LSFTKSLKGRLAIIAAIAIVVTGTVVLLFTFFMARSFMREQVFTSLEGVVSRTRGEILITIKSVNARGLALAATPRMARDIEAFSSTAVDRQAAAGDIDAMIRSADPSSASFMGITVVSRDGKVIAATGPSADPGARAPEIPAGEVKPGVPYVTFNIDASGLIITSAIPVTGAGSSQITGLVISQARSPELETLLSDTSGLGSTGRIVLSDFVARKMQVAWFRDSVEGSGSASGLARVPADEDLPYIKAARGDKGEEESRGLFGQSIVSSYDFVPGVEWGVTASTDTSEAFAPIYGLRNVSIVVILVLLFGGSALAYLIARSITRPLVELQGGVKAIADGDLSTRVKISDGTEVMALADEFNSMAERLDELYETLERKVAERTVELQEANERLKELDDLKSEFVTLASHELRSPMASMKMGVSTVLREMVGPLNDDQKLMLEIAERNIDRLTLLTGELLDLTKIEAGQFEIQPEDSDLLELAGEVALANEPLASENGLTLEVVPGRGPFTVSCDRERIYQVIQNLVSNAIGFTDEGGVAIYVDNAGAGEVSVRVKDTGIGLDPSVVPTIFDKWSRAHNETRSEKRGTGLGLAICKGIVEAHGGSISIESEPGGGTEAGFALPVRSQDERKKEDTDSR
jgi:signal transduction histidine kinase